MSTLSAKPRTKVENLLIQEDQAGQRIDNFLMSYIKGVPRSHIYRLLRTGQVRVNKKRIRPDYRIQSGDQLRIPPVVRSEEKTVSPDPRAGKILEQRILYEDDALLILNKPSGMAVHGGSGLSYGVIEALRATRKDAHYLELVHRLDRETSGCLMIAKKRSELRRLHRLLREGTSKKLYQTLLSGRWMEGIKTVSAPLLKNILKSGERIVRVDESGKEAVSIFEPLEIFATASLMQVELLTGRTHQIRVHASHVGHPIAGDNKYGDSEFNRQMKKFGLKRLFLHAAGLEFTVPDTHKKVKVRAPLDDELEVVLKKLRQNAG